MIDKILEEIATKGSIYDEIINNIIQPNYHLKPYLISELAISFLENRKKLNEVIEGNYFIYYFIRAVKNQIHSKTSGFHKITRIKDNITIDNINQVEDDGLERKYELEEMYKLIDKNYVKIPKTYFQEYLWHQYYTLNKTHRQIGTENDISYCLSFHEIKKIKELLIEEIKKSFDTFE
jgi:DNA polymerase III delta prime subunit